MGNRSAELPSNRGLPYFVKPPRYADSPEAGIHKECSAADCSWESTKPCSSSRCSFRTIFLKKCKGKHWPPPEFRAPQLRQDTLGKAEGVADTGRLEE